jgi:tetratricopeptide (TPR) repeat protein
MKENVMKALIAVLILSSALFAQTTMQMSHEEDHRPVSLVSGIGNSNHPIRISTPEAQKYFNQGLDYIWAFNHDEARRSFQKAAELDPSAAMPFWGVALAVGPNYNDIDIGHVRSQQAITALAKARSLAQTQPERDYIRALSTRYSGTGDNIVVHGNEYADAMKALAASYPNDLDASVLYAEALMDLNPWKLWNPDGSAAPHTDEIVSTLQAVLKKDPLHIGANHLLIHATESSPHPEIAITSAKYLEDATPAAGHLVHMPAHTYQRTGNFSGSQLANERAVSADRAYFQSQHLESVTNMYYNMYYVHNIHFLAAACAMEGNNACTQKAAADLVSQVIPATKDHPETEWFTPTQPWMLTRFQQWETILAAPMPDPRLKDFTAFWHYARGSAFAAQHKFPEALKERAALAERIDSLPANAIPDFMNPAKSALQLALDVLDARTLEAQGKLPEAIEVWKKAVALNDTFVYNEPADWYYPVRESLGGALLRAHKPAEAEAIFRRDLELNPGSGRSLYGLWQSQLALHKSAEAEKTEVEFKAAWKLADTTLSVSTL